MEFWSRCWRIAMCLCEEIALSATGQLQGLREIENVGRNEFQRQVFEQTL